MKKHFLALLVASLALTGCGSPQKPAEQPTAPAAVPKPVAVVIAPAEFDEAALDKVEEQLKQRQIAYERVSIQAGKFVAESGKEVEVRKTSWEVKPEDYRAVIFVGGPGMAAIAKDDTFKLMAQNFATAGKKLAAFGEGNEVLREAGILGGQEQSADNATSSAAIDDSDSIEQVIGSLSE